MQSFFHDLKNSPFQLVQASISLTRLKLNSANRGRNEPG